MSSSRSRGSFRGTRKNAVNADALSAKAYDTRRAIVVLGMHRSGTSALTRIISLLGADLPKNLDRADSGRAGEAGHWESAKLIDIHDQLLASGGSTWDDWRSFNPDWAASDVAELYKQKLLNVLKQDFRESRFFVIKDPRICRFVPLWLEVLDRFGTTAHVVIPIRNPLEVAASLQRRNGFPPAKSYLLWLRHVLDAEEPTRHMPRAFLAYDALLDNWRGVVANLATQTEIHWPRRSDYTEAEIDRYITAELRHHVAEPAQLATRLDIAGWVKEAYGIFRHMAEEGESDSQLERLDRIRAEFNSASTTFGLVLAGEAAQNSSQLHALESRVKMQDEELAKLSGELTLARQAESERQSKTEEITSTTERLSADLIAVQSVASERKNELDKLTSELMSAQSALREHDGEAVRLTQELDSVRLLLRESQAEVQRLAGERDGEVGHLTRELDSVRLLLRESQAEVQRLAGERDSEVGRLTRELDSLRLLLRESQAEVQHLAGERDSEVERLARELDSLRLLLRESQAEIQHLAGERDGAQAELELVNTESASMAKAFATASEELALVRRRAEDLQKHLSAVHQEIAAQAVRTRDLEVRLEQEKEEKKRLESIHASAVESEQNARAEIRALRDLLIDAEAALARHKNPGRDGGPLMRLLSAPRRRTKRRLLNSGLFDPKWYLREYPDVAKTGRSPVEHYLEEGYLRGYRPNPLFDTRWYLERYEDVRRTGVNPLVHYLRYGCREGRNPSPEFETDFYLLTYPDVRMSGMNPLAHFLRYGKDEGRLSMKPRDSD
jgi:hypothetical protein